MKLLQAILLIGFGGLIGVFAMNIPNSLAHESEPTQDDNYFYEGYCHQNNNEFDHFLEQFSEEDRIIVEAYLNTLMLEYEDEFISMYERHEIMDDLFLFIEEQGIDVEPYYNDYNNDWPHHRMR